jgi:hypothetical protein
VSTASGRSRRVALVVLLAFLSGAAVGAVASSGVASRSASVALHGAAGLFAFDQEQKVAAAWSAGDMNTALAHARCAYEAAFGSGSRYFDTGTVGWSVWGGALTHRLIVEPNADVISRARPTGEAITRAKMAVILERLGRGTEAAAELERAAQASGIADTAKLRELGLKTVASAATPTGAR